MPVKLERQYRAMLLESPTDSKRFESDYYVEGYAAKYAPYLFFTAEDGPVYERFERDAFKDADMTDVIMQYDHAGRVFARQSNGTLITELDDTGLFIAADLSKTEQAKGLYEDIAAGMITRMSWAFLPDRYYFDEDTRTIVHTRIKKIFDVSAVSVPANNDTDIHARTFADGAIEQVRRELAKRRRQTLKILLMTEE